MTERDTGERRYLLGDGLGSVRHVVDDAGVVVAYREYDPYGSPVAGDESGYSFTGERLWVCCICGYCGEF